MPSTIIEPVEAHAPTAREFQVTGLSDRDLVRSLYETVSKVPDDEIPDRLYLLISEAVERWAPHVELADRIATVYRDELSDPEGEIEASLERIVGRFAARIQLHARRLAGGDDA